MTTNEKVLALSRWIDDGVPDPTSEAQQWHRVAKVSEEAGEAVAALLGYVGRNPRKGHSHSLDDLEKELFDVAVAALGAIAHLRGNDSEYDVMAGLDAALDMLLVRAKISGAAPMGFVEVEFHGGERRGRKR